MRAKLNASEAMRHKLSQVTRMAGGGATLAEIARELGVSERTLLQIAERHALFLCGTAGRRRGGFAAGHGGALDQMAAALGVTRGEAMARILAARLGPQAVAGAEG